MSTSPAQQEHLRQHRRETVMYMIVPLAVTVFIVLLGVVVIFLLPRQPQVGILADWMMMVMVLCPALICTTAISIVLIVAVVLMRRANRLATRPLQQLNEMSQKVADQTTKAAESVNAATINAASRFAFLDRLFNIFDMPDKDTKANHHE